MSVLSGGEEKKKGQENESLESNDHNFSLTDRTDVGWDSLCNRFDGSVQASMRSLLLAQSAESRATIASAREEYLLISAAPDTSLVLEAMNR
ncbi:Uncharacterized protein DAT39_000217 [Clarias magur]|uniref:Uncharacterized protein n=1 Tax=Clarias magur TaxID=1594786 RepID=A0A8J4XHN0_CLAMG|nr:Uncharacterized protein DAT39_000217 [Clarias magur]